MKRVQCGVIGWYRTLWNTTLRQLVSLYGGKAGAWGRGRERRIKFSLSTASKEGMGEFYKDTFVDYQWVELEMNGSAITGIWLRSAWHMKLL